MNLTSQIAELKQKNENLEKRFEECERDQREQRELDAQDARTPVRSSERIRAKSSANSSATKKLSTDIQNMH